MTPVPPVEIEVIDPPTWAAAGEPVAVGFLVRRPADRTGPAVLRQVAAGPGTPAEVDADLFERDVEVHPGEAYRCTVRVTFTRPGPADLGSLFVQAADPSPDRSALVWLPTSPVRVVPSLAREVAVRVTRVCGYELGTKVEVELAHRGSTRFAGFRAAVGPAGRVRAGVCEHARPTFDPGDVLRFDAVVAGPEVEVVLDAEANGGSAGPVRVAVPVPTDGGAAAQVPFRFLEARRLTADRVRVRDAADGRDVAPVGGAFPVTGGAARYLVVVHPTDPAATAVALHGDPGAVEVSGDRPLAAGGWEFAVVVVKHPYLTTPVRLAYDVIAPAGPSRGEVHLSVRPRWWRHWAFAATLGAAVTLKGAAAAGQAVFSPDAVWEDVPELITAVRPANLGYLVSIPVVALAFNAADWVNRRFGDE